VLAMRGAWYALGHRLGWLDGGTVLRRVAAAYLAGRRAAELARQGEEWFIERGAAAIYREAAELVSDHRRAGTPVVLLSGGMDFLVAPVARALGAARWAAVEPEVQDGVLTGRLREPLCIDDGKVHWASAVARELGVRLDECTFYTDDVRAPRARGRARRGESGSPAAARGGATGLACARLRGAGGAGDRRRLGVGRE